MGNHSFHAQCNKPEWNATSESFSIVAESDIPVGAQILLNYGALQSFEFMLFYGFCPEGANPYDRLVFDFEPDDDDENVTEKTVLMEATGLRGDHFLRVGHEAEP